MELGKSNIFRFSAILMVTALITSLILSVANEIIKPKIIIAEKEKFKTTLEAAWGKVKIKEATSVSEKAPYLYKNGTKTMAEIEKHFIIEGKGESFLVKSNGRNGVIRSFISLDQNGKVLTFDMLSLVETKGIWEKANNGYKNKIGYSELSATNTIGVKPITGKMDYRIIANDNPSSLQAGATLTAWGIRSSFRGIYHFVNSKLYDGHLKKGAN